MVWIPSIKGLKPMDPIHFLNNNIDVLMHGCMHFYMHNVIHVHMHDFLSYGFQQTESSASLYRKYPLFKTSIEQDVLPRQDSWP